MTVMEETLVRRGPARVDRGPERRVESGAPTADVGGARSRRRLTKRALDVTVSILLLLMVLPVVIVLAVVVRCDGGPVLFRQRRIGRDGVRFTILKFRTMAADAEQRLHADPALYRRYVDNAYKLPAAEDPRTTRLGRALRRSSLDELPQLLNVLRGDMSLVGPRPIVEPELIEYRRRHAADAYLTTRPGLTGLWQVSGRSRLGYDDRVALDQAYLGRACMRADLVILARTVVAVVRADGAH